MYSEPLWKEGKMDEEKLLQLLACPEKVVDCQTGEIVWKRGWPVTRKVVERVLYGLPTCPADCAKQWVCPMEDWWDEHGWPRKEQTSRDSGPMQCRYVAAALDFLAYAANYRSIMKEEDGNDSE